MQPIRSRSSQSGPLESLNSHFLPLEKEVYTVSHPCQAENISFFNIFFGAFPDLTNNYRLYFQSRPSPRDCAGVGGSPVKATGRQPEETLRSRKKMGIPATYFSVCQAKSVCSGVIYAVDLARTQPGIWQPPGRAIYSFPHESAPSSRALDIRSAAQGVCFFR